MSEEFNIFKNLEELRKTNLLEQLKSLEPNEITDLNDSQGLDDFDFDAIVNGKDNKKSPSKRRLNNGKTTTPEKQSRKARTKSTSTDGSLSPTIPLLENLGKKAKELPVGRRTRRSAAACAETEQGCCESLCTPSPQYTAGRKNKSRGRGRGRGRGRDKANARQSVNGASNSTDLSENSSSIDLRDSEQQDDASNQTEPALSIMQRFLQQGSSRRSRVMRGRRRYLAEIAARSTQIDFIDLVSSPMPRVEGFIDLDLYTEEESPQRTTRSRKKKNEVDFKSRNKCNSTNPTLDISFEEDNPELNIKVNWKGKPEAFKLRKHQKFCIIFAELAKRENIDIENIVFNLNDRIILADDTPDSIDYKIFHFIDGRVLSSRLASLSAEAPVVKRRDTNKITLKIQSDKWKRPLQMDMAKTEKFRILYIKCAEELNVAVDQLKLSFDGDCLDLNDTPTDLDLEGGEAIDLRIKN